MKCAGHKERKDEDQLPRMAHVNQERARRERKVAVDVA